MTSENGLWDPATVLGLRRNESVLVIGNPAFLPWLTTFFSEAPDQLLAVKKTSELEALLKERRVFDRVILSRETSYTHDYLLRSAAHKAQLVVFPKDDGWQIEQAIQFYYPEANIRKFESTFGPIMTTDAFGASWRIIYG